MTAHTADDGLFQSTPPVKAATADAQKEGIINAISIHAAREGGDLAVNISIYDVIISIHAAREGGDPRGCAADWRMQAFQSTPPVKAATKMHGIRGSGV